MKNRLSLSLITLFTLTNTAICMHTKLSTTRKIMGNRSYIITSQLYNPEKGRREAYQKWCPTPIIWDQNSHTIKKNQPTDKIKKEDAMTFYKQFSTK